MDTSFFREFVEVVACGSAAKAARRLNLSTSSLSRHMSAFERELGVTLFEKDNRARLTNDGIALMPVVTQIIKDLDLLENEALQLMSGRAYLLRVFYPSADLLSRDVLLRAKANLDNNVKVRLVHAGELRCSPYDALLNGAIDVVLGPSPVGIDEERLEVIRLFHDEMLICIERDSKFSKQIGDVDAVSASALRGMVMPVAVNGEYRADVELLDERAAFLFGGVVTERIFASDNVDYFSHIKGNRFGCIFPGIEGKYVRANRDSVRTLRVEGEGINADRTFTIRRGDRRGETLRLAAAIREVAQANGFEVVI